MHRSASRGDGARPLQAFCASDGHFRAVVLTLLVITFALFAALWRGLGWI
jgi:hypothetical protein